MTATTSTTRTLACPHCGGAVPAPARAVALPNPITRGEVALWISIWGWISLGIAGMFVLIEAPQSAQQRLDVAAAAAIGLLLLAIAAQVAWGRSKKPST